MSSRPHWQSFSAALLLAATLAATLAACGGGSGGAASPAAASTAPPLQSLPGAPQATGNTALDGFNWINYRRAMVGLPQLTRNARIDVAAQGQSNYQLLNHVATLTHVQTPGAPGYTGAQLLDRLVAADYPISQPYVFGEVISATSNSSGFYQVEGLIAAIYHRFLIFEPVFKEAGTGAVSATGGYTYFTCDFGANNGYGPGLASGQLVTYPVAGQTMVPPSFLSDDETPDAVPNQNAAGYPISVHANYGAPLTVQGFSVRPHGGGADLPVRLLSNASDPNTPTSAAAIIPLAPLAAASGYDVAFSGQVNGVAVTRNWSFTTQ